MRLLWHNLIREDELDAEMGVVLIAGKVSSLLMENILNELQYA